MRVLVIEDDTETRSAIEKKLTEEGFNVYSTELGEEGIGLGRFYNYDILILDLKLPDVHGYDVLRRLREAKVNTPILILSGVLGVNSKSKALWGGADDYMTKPFDFRELVARMHAIIRRSHGFAESVVKTGRLSINLLTKVVEVDEQPLHMTKKEYLIMELLSLCKGTLVTKEMFLNHLYGGLYEPNQKIIDVVICKLRKKIAHVTGGQNIIFTDWGRGYILRDGAEAKEITKEDKVASG